MSRPIIQIQVAGRHGSGKSTIATLLAAILQANNVPVEHVVGPDGPIRGDAWERLESIATRLRAEGSVVQIIEAQFNRDGSVPMRK